MTEAVPEPIDLGPLTDRSIALCGFMGVGKSSIGRRLARRLGRPFYDLDELLVQKFNAPIAEIFNEGREPEFREIEARSLEELIALDQSSVIALGGGAYENEGSRDLLARKAFVIHLDQSWEALYPALNKLREHRPLLLNRTNDEIFTLYQQRRKTYLLADLSIAIPRAGVAVATRTVIHALFAYIRTITN